MTVRALVLVLVGCVGCLVAPDEVRTRDGGTLDTGRPSPDTGAPDTVTTDARPDAPEDTGPDSPQDAPEDTGRPSPDVAGDARDEGTDAPQDAPGDAGTDTPDVTVCPPGRGDCDSDPANGCETDTATDLANCGRCGGACPAGGSYTTARTCESGVCRYTCMTGVAACAGQPVQGCFTVLGNDEANCGACGRVCDAGTRCSVGECR